MSAINETIDAFARGVGRGLRLPTVAILMLATVAVGLALILAVVNATTAPAVTAGHLVVLAIPMVLAVPVVIFAIRRRRWLRLTSQDSSVVTTEVVRADDLADRVEYEMRGQPGAEDVKIVLDAFTEGSLPAGYGGKRRNRFFNSSRLGIVGHAFTKMEKAQRALLVAAGGPVRAPYLKDDLRISGLALLGTIVAIPLGSTTALIIGLALLAG